MPRRRYIIPLDGTNLAETLQVELVSREVVVNLIGNTTTKTGLNIQAKLDEHSYPNWTKN